MSNLSNIRVIVVGEGALGLAVAAGLARAGAAVVLAGEPGAGDSASMVAAGMLAPALETALDPGGEAYSELRDARDLWPAFADGLGDIGLVSSGARFRAPRPVLERTAARLSVVGAAFETGDGEIVTPEDWRLDPALALAAMRRQVMDGGGRAVRGPAMEANSRTVRLADGQVLTGDAVVLACGFGGLDLAPELALLRPIKGQILKFAPGALAGGPVLRGPDGYVAPGASGAAAGATMETGRSDRRLDEVTVERLRAMAIDLAPELAGAAFIARAGVRAETPDRRPLIGRSRTGVWLAAGARRNGWLLAPTAAGLIVQGLAGAPDTPAYSPGRFTLPA